MRFFKLPWEHFRESKDTFLLVHKRGEYEYHNPDFTYVHKFETFRTREDAERYIEQRIPLCNQGDWRLYELVGREQP